MKIKILITGMERQQEYIEYTLKNMQQECLIKLIFLMNLSIFAIGIHVDVI